MRGFGIALMSSNLVDEYSFSLNKFSFNQRIFKLKLFKGRVVFEVKTSGGKTSWTMVSAERESIIGVWELFPQ